MKLPALRPRPDPALGAAAIGPEEEALVLDVLRRRELFRYYGTDPSRPPPMAARLEARFREVLGRPFALAVTSGTAALEAALIAAGIGPGDAVIIPAYSWISCFLAVARVRARPVLAEMDDSLSLDPAEVARLADGRTRAVLTVHYQGVAVDLDPLLSVCRDRKLLLVEDCAQSMGARYQGRPVGSIGDLATFSFQYAKVATAGEGGLVAMSAGPHYERAVRFSDLGLYRPYHAALHPATEPPIPGGQCRMSELTAAVALAQFEKLASMRGHTRRLRDRLMSRLRALPGLQHRRIPDPDGDWGYETYVYLPTPELAVAFRERLNALNVNAGQRTGTSPHYDRDYVKQGWSGPGYRREDFPRTEALVRRSLAFPIGWRYTEDDIDYAGDCIEQVHRELLGA